MSKPLARILLVDDDENARRTMVLAFAGNGWEIDSFNDVETAAGRIGTARSEGWEYDAAVLDIRLPRSPRDRGTSVDESLCNLVRHYTFVWHISAHFGEEEVEAHMKACHSADEQLKRIEKKQGYVVELERQIKQALATRRIRASLAMLQSPSESGYARRFRPDSTIPSVTSLIATVCADIRESWKALAPKVQDELREWFEIELDDQGEVRTVYPR